METIRNLIKQVATISKKNAEILDATGGRFNMFSVCGVNHYENKHSAIIAEFLNPDGKHGLKSKLLECFIETLGKKFTLQNFNCGNAQVHTEHSTKEGRIDILITDDQNKAIIIENKIYATDQSEQLIRYNRYAQTYKKGYQILYLTLSGNEASEQSGKNVPYSQVSYKADIINWLEKCVAIASRFPMVRETIIQYINHLKQLTGQDMDAKNKEEIIEMLSENLEAAKAISQNYPETFKHILETRFNKEMTDFAKQKGLDYLCEECSESHVSFRFTKSSWHKDCWIEFTFERAYFYGLHNDPVNGISAENQTLIYDELRKSVSCKKDVYWPVYVYLDNLTLNVWNDDIIRGTKFLKDCQERIEQILNAMKEAGLYSKPK